MELSEFKKYMDETILELKNNGSSHRLIQCQILLVIFMRDVVADTNDEEIHANLIWWVELCDDKKDLVYGFSRFMRLLRPHLLRNMGCNFDQVLKLINIDNHGYKSYEEIRPLYFSVFVLDWIIRTSKLLTDVQKNEWSTRVLRNWFETEEDAKDFFDRAEVFLNNSGQPLVLTIHLQNPYLVRLCI